MTEHWPASLPQFFYEQGYAESAADERIDSPTDFGPSKTRKRFTRGRRQITGMIGCTDEQAEALAEFYEDTLNAGVDAFLWVSPISQWPARFVFRGRNPPKLIGRDTDLVLVQLELLQTHLYAPLRFDSTDVTFDSMLDTFDQMDTY